MGAIPSHTKPTNLKTNIHAICAKEQILMVWVLACVRKFHAEVTEVMKLRAKLVSTNAT